MTKEYLVDLQRLLEEAVSALPPDVDLEINPMFGGMGAFVRGRVFAILYDGGIALKLSEDHQEELLQVEGASRDAPISKKYIVVPQTFLEDNTLLQPWVEKSVNYALTLPLPKKKKKA